MLTVSTWPNRGAVGDDLPRLLVGLATCFYGFLRTARYDVLARHAQPPSRW